ncbi:AI-2E family transporter [Prochlorococcus sp. MIT 1307]|uniref:AI-2E family transporter n=1 Tax=Prochlorococcus sp. MIT 1307 TaxID=3096219 RepID=UPI002A7612CC|nr:AI-2E family transporter [Prochlorococcus sp. MIT 1307]
MKLPHWLALSALLSAGVILWSLKEILIQIFAGIVLAMALCTLVEKLRSIIPIARPIALLFSLSIILIFVSLIFIIVLPPFAEEFQQLIVQLPNAASALSDIARENLEKVNEMIYGDYQEGTIGRQFFANGFNPLPDSSTLATGVGDGIKKILDLAGNVGSVFLKVLFILAVSLMISIQPIAYREVSILLIPSFYRRRARRILLDCGKALSNWMVGVLISSLCVALLAGIGLSILGVKLVIANAILAGILNVIPNVGPVISTIFPMSVALLDEPWKAIAVLGMYIFIQNLESYLITPSVMHHQVKLLPGLTLTAQFIFTVVFGPIGLILALPLTVVLQVLIKEIVIKDLLDPWKKKHLAR